MAHNCPYVPIWLDSWLVEAHHGHNAIGDEALHQGGVMVIPDILANAGGVTVSYYEWVQNRRSESWDLAEVDRRLKEAMEQAYSRMIHAARQYQTDYRTACYCVALERLQRVYEERELFP